MMDVYITSTGAFLPGPPIAVEEVEDVLGAVNGKPSSLRVQIQKANKIQTRHYAIDKDQRTTPATLRWPPMLPCNASIGLFCPGTVSVCLRLRPLKAITLLQGWQAWYKLN